MSWKFWQKKTAPIPAQLGEPPWIKMFECWSIDEGIYWDIYPCHEQDCFGCNIVYLSGVGKGDYTIKIYGYGHSGEEAVRNAWRRWGLYFGRPIMVLNRKATDLEILRTYCITLPVFYDSRKGDSVGAKDMPDELRRRLM